MTDVRQRRTFKGTFDPAVFLAHEAGVKRAEKYDKNQKIFVQGDVADAAEHGKEAVVGILAEGQFFGEACLGGAKLRTATSQAMEECLITSIPKAAMAHILNTDPEFSAVFMAYLLSRNSRIEDDLIDQLFNSSERRLARLLLLLANFGQEGGNAPVAITLSQETLAEMIGTTRSRVSFFMNKFRKQGFIDYNGKIEVHASLLDAVLRDKPQIQQDE
jgi:CRP-like cAMP-binding protein